MATVPGKELISKNLEDFAHFLSRLLVVSNIKPIIIDEKKWNEETKFFQLAKEEEKKNWFSEHEKVFKFCLLKVREYHCVGSGLVSVRFIRPLSEIEKKIDKAQGEARELSFVAESKGKTGLEYYWQFKFIADLFSTSKNGDEVLMAIFKRLEELKKEFKANFEK